MTHVISISQHLLGAGGQLYKQRLAWTSITCCRFSLTQLHRHPSAFKPSILVFKFNSEIEIEYETLVSQMQISSILD